MVPKPMELFFSYFWFGRINKSSTFALSIIDNATMTDGKRRLAVKKKK